MSYDPYGQPAATPPPPAVISPAIETQPTTRADRFALIALTVALTTILSCVVPGFSCLAPLAVGIVALTQAGQAADPKRAQTYSWIAIAIGGLILIGVLAFIALYGALIATVINESGGFP
ncbi:MAG TPA: hypothetical protein PKA05_07885 [Roseiflexaceae bacterium]|nr:hypothetical protein [Roseiflexaceae bacterium]HMP40283.1 hypothetical protein [Roseiflexaceae bacterium]